eukprot:UN31068
MDADDDWGDLDKETAEDNIITEKVVAKKEILYVILEEKDVREEMDKRIKTLTNAGIGENNDESTLILQYFKWKPTQATDKFWGDSEKTRVECGVDITPGATKYEDNGECNICLDDFEKDEMFGLKCGHKFCTECFVENLGNASKNYGCIKLKCPEQSCKYAVTTERIKALNKTKGVSKNEIANFQKRWLNLPFKILT